MKVIEGGNFSWARVGFRGFKYPIVVSEDTEFRGSNFAQKSSHTDGVFQVAPGVTVKFTDHCNLTNCKIPDGAIIEGGNLAHIVPTDTGDASRPTVNLLCECEKCATALAQLQEDIKAGTLPKDRQGRILHHEMKARYAARRLDAAKVTADRTKAATGNSDALKRFGATLRSADAVTRLGRGA